MIALDLADLVVIAGRVIGIDAGTALAQADICAAQVALAQAHSEEPAPSSDRVAVASAGAGLVHALLRHRPFPPHGEQVAVAAVLQFLSLNGWQASLDPPAQAAVIVEALASGRLSPADAAAWLSPRLSPRRVLGPRAPRIGTARVGTPRSSTARIGTRRSKLASVRMPLAGFQALRTIRVARVTGAGRMLVSAMLAIAVGSLALLATACSQGPGTPAVNPRGQVAVRQSPGPERPALTPPTGSHARTSTRRANPGSAYAWLSPTP